MLIFCDGQTAESAVQEVKAEWIVSRYFGLSQCCMVLFGPIICKTYSENKLIPT